MTFQDDRATRQRNANIDARQAYVDSLGRDVQIHVTANTHFTVRPNGTFSSSMTEACFQKWTADRAVPLSTGY